MPKAQDQLRREKNDKLIKLKKAEKFVKTDPTSTPHDVRLRLKPLRTDPNTRENTDTPITTDEVSSKGIAAPSIMSHKKTAGKSPMKNKGKDGDSIRKMKSSSNTTFIETLNEGDFKINKTTNFKKDKKDGGGGGGGGGGPEDSDDGGGLVAVTPNLEEAIKAQREVSVRDLKNNTRIDGTDKAEASPSPKHKHDKKDEDVVYDNVKTPDLVLDEKTLFVLERKHYEIHKKIYEGAYCEVYKGIHKIRNQQVAIKITDLLRIEKQFREMFIPREAAQLSDVRHRNILSILDVIKAGAKIFVFSEWADGGNLKQHVQDKGPMSEDLAGEYYSQIASAVEFIHNQLRLVHRSIKLNSVYLHKNIIRLSDFNFAKNFWDGTNNQVILADTIIGTEPYFSPQMLERVSFNPYANDVWACGVTLFAMINNRYPYHAGKRSHMLQEQKTKDFLHSRYIKKFSSDLLNLLTLHFVYDESRRITISDVIKHPWVKRHTKNS